jgi:hypothetical protein
VVGAVGNRGDDAVMTVSAYAIGFRLPRRLRLRGELNGAVLATYVAGLGVEMHLPRITPAFGLDRSHPERFMELPGEADFLGNWGTALAWRDHDRLVESFDVEVVGFMTRGDNVRVMSYWTGAELSEWFEAMADWVEVLAGQVNEPRARRVQQPVWGDGMPRWSRTSGKWAYTAPQAVVDCSVPEASAVWGRAATAAELSMALERVTGGERPTVRDLLLRDARTHLLANEFRRAVLDAGLAAELTLVQAFVEALGPGVRLTKKLEPSECALKVLLDRAPDHGIVLDDVFGDEQRLIRNDAVHRGMVTRADALFLVDSAFRLREVLAPRWPHEVEVV